VHPAAETTPAGNTYDKYGTRHPVARRLVDGFLGELDAMVDRVGPRELLDVGCGEGIVTERMLARPGVERAVGLDRGSECLALEWSRRARPGLELVTGDAHSLPWPGQSFDLTCSLEVLMQVTDPPRALAELARVSRGYMIASAAREPIWRVLNVARGAYVRALGNSPGNIHHFSKREFTRMCAGVGEVLTVVTPFPWTLVLLRVRPPES